MTSISSFFKVLLICFLITACSNEDESAGTTNNPRILNLQSTGDSANELLSAKSHTSLILELVSVRGFEPQKESIDNLVDFIEQRTFKPGGIDVRQRSIPSSGKDVLTIQQIDSLETVNRSQLSTPNEHAIYIYFSDADNKRSVDPENESPEGEGLVLGTAYRNTSMVIYENTLRRLTTSINNPDRRREILGQVETFTLQHEYCHLLGLVNLGTRLQTPHEDVDDEGKPNNHCNVDGCLMQANAAFENNMMDGSLRTLVLDPLCIQDLKSNGGR